tara:strand:- start:237 stop:848 length:612 start_codon:yes stop_codon:yes gene_type:complete
MSTLKTTNITHNSNSGTANIVLDSSGNIEIPDKIIHSGDTNTAIRFSAADTVAIETGGSARLTVDANGIVVKPNQPSFRAQRSGTSWNHSNGTLAWDNEIFDINNDYDTSSYTFTCPVDGVYLFICSVMQEHGGTGGNMTFKKNGSTFNTTQWTAAGGTSDWDGYDMVAIINCSANDAILSAHNSNSNFHGGNYAHFSGYLIG